MESEHSATQFEPFKHELLDWPDILEKAVDTFDQLKEDHLQSKFVLYSDVVPVGAPIYSTIEDVNYQNFDVKVHLLHVKEPNIGQYTILSDGTRTSLKTNRMIILCIHLLIFERAKLLNQPYEETSFHLKEFYNLPDKRNEMDIIDEFLPFPISVYFKRSKTYALCMNHLKSQFISARPNISLY